MARCPDCNKFTGLETQDPEMDDPEVDDPTEAGEIRVHVTGRVERNCTDCGTLMKSYDYECEDYLNVDPAVAAEHIDSVNVPVNERKHGAQGEEVSATVNETHGKGRRAATTFTLDVEIKVTCECGFEFGTLALSDSARASDFNDEV